MRAYSASDEEALRARNLLKEWAGEGYISGEQYRRMEQETVCDLRRTNIFLRLVLFLFTLIVVGAAVALFFTVFLSHPSEQTQGVFLLILAGIAYAVAEFAVSGWRLYRYGIEEALVVCAVVFLWVGLYGAVFGHLYSTSRDPIESVVFIAGVFASLWIWGRFGPAYAFVGAMLFVLPLPGYWTTSRSAQHLIIVAFYAAGLVAVAAASSRRRVAYFDDDYSIAEALLWLGIYLAINVQLSSLNLLGKRWGGPGTDPPEFSRGLYWATWVLTWCLPPVVLWRGLRRKDRPVIAVGGIIAVLTLATNKPYLGWPRHTWDPMLLGILLAGVALFIRRRLAAEPDGIRRGFTARRLSAKDKQWMSAGSVALGLAAPHSVTVTPPPGSPAVKFGGGDSGGGGASSDF